MKFSSFLLLYLLAILSLFFENPFSEYCGRGIVMFDRRSHFLIIITVTVICGNLVSADELVIMLAFFHRKQGSVSLKRSASNWERNQRLH